jgi:uncharacterized protein YpmB
MGKTSEQFKALPLAAKFVVIVIVVAIGFAVYFVVSGGAKKSHAEDACKDAVKAKVGQSVKFVGESHTTNAAEGRYDVTGQVQAPNGAGIIMQATYDCLVDGDGSNADVEILGG